MNYLKPPKKATGFDVPTVMIRGKTFQKKLPLTL